MSTSKKLIKQTAIYGLATVFPRMLSFLLVVLYTGTLPKTNDYGSLTIIMSYMVFLNVLLSYGMETAFFRFYNLENDKEKVLSSSTVSIFWSSIIFLVFSLVFRRTIAHSLGIETEFVTYTVWILVLDALVIIPFSKLRVLQKSMTYALVKMGNVSINLGFNLFFLLVLPALAQQNYPFWKSIYLENFQVGYILIANILASLFTFLFFIKEYATLDWQLDYNLWKKMMHYGLPILIAGIAFAVNEHFDKIILGKLLPENIAKAEVGVYSACYKLALFMTLYATAFRLGIEPFFFSYAQQKNASATYAQITKYFIVFGAIILVGVLVFIDVLKVFLLQNKAYWEAIGVVPLILVANFFLGIYTNLSVWYKLNNKTHIGAYISIVGALVTLVLNFWLIPLYSYYGSAVATIFAYGSMMFLSYYLGQKQYPIPYPIKEISIYLGSSIAIGFGVFYFLRAQYWITIPVLALYLGWIYKQEKIFFQKLIRAKETKG